jgi:hypothetical protein
MLLRATAERRRADHVPNLAGRCRIDGHPHPCYDHTTAGMVLATVGEPGTPVPSSSTAVRVLLTSSAHLAVAALAAVWLVWVQ